MSKEVIRSRKSKWDRQYNGKKRDKNQTMVYKALHRKLNIESSEPS
jgi:hypothetical protein